MGHQLMDSSCSMQVGKAHTTEAATMARGVAATALSVHASVEGLMHPKKLPPSPDMLLH